MNFSNKNYFEFHYEFKKSLWIKHILDFATNHVANLETKKIKKLLIFPVKNLRLSTLSHSFGGISFSVGVVVARKCKKLRINEVKYKENIFFHHSFLSKTHFTKHFQQKTIKIYLIYVYS